MKLYNFNEFINERYKHKHIGIIDKYVNKVYTIYGYGNEDNLFYLDSCKLSDDIISLYGDSIYYDDDIYGFFIIKKLCFVPKKA